MGDNGRFYLKLVKATLITIVMLGHHGRGKMDMFWGTMDHGAPLLALMSTVPRLQRKYIFFNLATPKMKNSAFKYHFYIFHFTIENGLIDTGSPYNMPVDMYIVPHPHVHDAPSSVHHGHLLAFF